MTNIFYEGPKNWMPDRVTPEVSKLRGHDKKRVSFPRKWKSIPHNEMPSAFGGFKNMTKNGVISGLSSIRIFFILQFDFRVIR
ncbi:MAG: hypothetical protein SCALA702_25770 [Melioribacteraceae bacterium]|nr:MAG: hypothetical protein SCALA702_25770 [Melioribacteraceae bacterium]